MANPLTHNLLLQRRIEAACLLEVTARKPGNVHPARSFADLEYSDFVRSARIVAPILANVSNPGVGEAIRTAAVWTKNHVGRNTNLGILLLIAPLAAVPPDQTLADGIADILAALDTHDCEDAGAVFEAIRIAEPGGLGDVDDQDIAAPPSVRLIECMKLAADRDTIAQQYTDGFQQVLKGATQLQSESFEDHWEQSVIRLQLSLLSATPDTLIARKCGSDIARAVSSRAGGVLDKLPADFEASHPALLKFDRYLRLDGHRLNPGTTADLVAACLFAALRERKIVWTGRIDLACVASRFAHTANIQTANE
jgi:triphosphoribosyl-dephospho-CoA synthase